MDTSADGGLRQAIAEFDEVLEESARLRERLDAIRACATARDRSVQVTLDVYGEVRELKFLTDDYRDMPPAKLGRLLVDTVAKASREAAKQADDVTRPLREDRDRLRDSLGGDEGWTALFGSVDKGR